MSDTHVPSRVFRGAKQEAETVKAGISTPQTENPAYRLAFQDMDFLLREDLRPVRFQLELLKPQLLLGEANIGSTFVFYGSARIPEPSKAQAMLDAAEGEQARKVAQSLVDKSHYYEVARELARMVSQLPRDESGKRQFVVCSGGGPSIMEAANRGAADVGEESVGLNIVLPHEQAPNPYVTPSLSMQFHYFALRKMHFLLHARALAAFPGGFGTFDELFELLTLIQTGKIDPIPVLLYGRDFWSRVVNFEALCEEGVISPRDLDIFTIVETAEEGWNVVKQFYRARREAEESIETAGEHARHTHEAQAPMEREGVKRMDSYDLVAETPTLGDYRRLRVAAGLSAKSVEAAAAGLPNTIVGVVIRHDGAAVGMGRVIGDGGLFFQVVDIAVEPAHQGRGLGKRIVGALLDRLREIAPAGGYVSLIADGEANRLYTQFGFRPTAPASIGMALTLD